MRTSSRTKISQLQATRYLFNTNYAALDELTDEGPAKVKMLVLALEITLLSDSLGSSIVLKYGGWSKLRKAEFRKELTRPGNLLSTGAKSNEFSCSGSSRKSS